MFKYFRKTLPLFSLALPLYLTDQRRRPIQCCGIIGVLTTNKNAEQIIMEGVHLLENRGYDSAGIVTIKENQEKNDLVVSKYASDVLTKQDCFQKIESEISKHKSASSGIGHTRWATCGTKIDRNAHPHVDMNNRVALVHNGTLENYIDLKEELIKQHGVTFTSETDTEVIVQFIGLFLTQGSTFIEAVELTLAKLRGQWGLVIIDKNSPDEMIVCRKGSPILVGYNSDSIFAASEKVAFEKYTQTYIKLKDGEIMQLKLSQRSSMFDQIKHRIQVLEECHSPVSSKPRAPYKSFYEQEIHEQPNSILRALGNGGRLAGNIDSSKLGGLERFEQEICGLKNLIFMGCGSSYLAALCVISMFRQFHIFETVMAIEASEFNVNDIPQSQPGFIMLSQSGETKDVIVALEQVQNQGAFSIAIVNVVGSVIATSVDCGVYMNCGREVGVAASKSFTSQVTCLILVGLWLSYYKEKNSNHQKSFKQLRSRIVEQLRSLPMTIGQTLHQCQDDVNKVAKVLVNHQNLLILGKGPCAAIAKEGALKIKELTYKHAEGFSAGELKHGPLALIDSSKDKSMPVILIILDNEFFNDMKLALSEVHSRSALTIVITDCANKLSQNQDKINHMIEIPFVGHEIGWLLAVIPFQLLALQMCVFMDIDPDKPRNLAKTVTVG